MFIELIDTLWNVNDMKKAETAVLRRINRYIMECKYIFKSRKRFTVFELIDTLWNVNSIETSIRQMHRKELIDTLWNVNASGQ